MFEIYTQINQTVTILAVRDYDCYLLKSQSFQFLKSSLIQSAFLYCQEYFMHNTKRDICTELLNRSIVFLISSF